MIVFDMAGTTVDENNLVYKAVRQAVNEKGYEFSLEQVLAVAAGQEKLQAIRSVLALADNTDEDLAKSIFERFKILLDQAYNAQPISEQPNTLEVFKQLRSKNILAVLNTGYSRDVAEKLIRKLGWQKEKDFDALVTASDVTQARPHPDMILYAMKMTGISDAAAIIKVGDSIIDIEEGKNAGCRFSIGITTGAHTKAQLESADPDFIIDGLPELIPIVDEKIQARRI